MPRRVLHSRRTTKQLLCKFYPKVFMVQLSSWLGRDSVQYVRIDNCIVKEMEKGTSPPFDRAMAKSVTG